MKIKATDILKRLKVLRLLNLIRGNLIPRNFSSFSLFTEKGAYLFKTFVTSSAASLKVTAENTRRPELSIIFFASSALVP